MATRKQYSASLKTQVVEEMLKEEKSHAQIASEYGVHPHAMRKWKYAAQKAVKANFEDQPSCQAEIARLTAQYEKEQERLYAEIGKLTTQINWLKKKFPHLIGRSE